LWNNLKFRSATEQRVAEELDKRGIMFFPNCTARLGMRNDRKNKEADFLVCYKGKWGILEVDGPHHSGRADVDHDRDRLFKQHGIVVIEHFNHEECYKNTGQVVAKFLSILERV
jgi:very-short-patch-repair endonuclease